MIIAQEIWYITKGNTRYRKAITVFYRVSPQSGRETVAFKEQGYDPKCKNVTIAELSRAINLPSLEVTPSQFRDVMTKRKNMFGI